MMNDLIGLAFHSWISDPHAGNSGPLTYDFSFNYMRDKCNTSWGFRLMWER